MAFTNLPGETKTYSFSANVDGALSAISSTYKATNSGFELVLYESCGLGNGSQANNPCCRNYQILLQRQRGIIM
jgi:hypothetical protein